MQIPWVDQLLEALPSTLFDEWQAYDQIESLGSERLHQQLALLAVAICAASGVKHKLDAFLPWHKSEVRRQTIDEKKAVCRALSAG